MISITCASAFAGDAAAGDGANGFEFARAADVETVVASLEVTGGVLTGRLQAARVTITKPLDGTHRQVFAA